MKNLFAIFEKKIGKSYLQKHLEEKNEFWYLTVNDVFLKQSVLVIKRPSTPQPFFFRKQKKREKWLEEKNRFDLKIRPGRFKFEPISVFITSGQSKICIWFSEGCAIKDTLKMSDKTFWNLSFLSRTFYIQLCCSMFWVTIVLTLYHVLITDLQLFQNWASHLTNQQK